MKKVNILFLSPGSYGFHLPDFCDKYKMLSDNFKGLILSMTIRGDAKIFRHKIGNFTFCNLSIKRRGWFSTLKWLFFVVSKSCCFHHKNGKFDVIVCYDPIIRGLAGVVLKYLLCCKLIIEINGDLLKANFLEKATIRKMIKRIIYKKLIKFSLSNADAVKLLHNDQLDILGISLKKRTFCFHDFVPTHYFISSTTSMEKIILFAGFPFYLKGIDILIKAFWEISDRYPDFTLRLIGHRLENDAKKYFKNLNGKIQFSLPMPYDRLKDEFLKCYCFVLASRSEGIPRVLLEAMASGKPVIGSNVGGTPEIIENEKNGFLFRSEDVNDLTSKLNLLLGSPKLAKEMGEYGRKLIQEKFSSEKYCENFADMIKKIVPMNG